MIKGRLKQSVLGIVSMQVKGRLEIPVDYKLIGNQQYLKRLVRKLSKNDLDLNISDIKKSDP